MAKDMNSKETITCLFCQATNLPSDDSCANCGQPLAVARTARYLDRAEADIAKGQYNQARANLTKADVEMLTISAEQRKQLLLTARAFYLHGLTYYHKGQIDEAKEEMLLARQNLEGQAGGDALLANVLNSLGNVEYYREHPDAAIAYYQSSSEAAMRAGAHSIAAKAIANLGNISTAQGNFDSSLGLYQRALAEATLAADPLRDADIYRLISDVYLKTGPISMAIEYVERSVALRDQFENLSALCRVLSDAGGLYLKCGELDRAATYLDEAYAIAQRTDYRLMQLVNLIYMAELAHRRGDEHAWLNYATHAFNMTSEAIVWRSHAALQLVEYYIGQQDWGHAQGYIRQIEDNVRIHALDGDRVHLSHARAILHAALDEWDEAAQDFEAAITPLVAAYDLLGAAALQDQYATMLLRRAAFERNPTVHARARAVLEQAVANYRQLGLTERLEPIEALLNSQRSNLLNRLKRIKQPQSALPLIDHSMPLLVK